MFWSTPGGERKSDAWKRRHVVIHVMTRCARCRRLRRLGLETEPVASPVGPPRGTVSSRWRLSCCSLQPLSFRHLSGATLSRDLARCAARFYGLARSCRLFQQIHKAGWFAHSVHLTCRGAETLQSPHTQAAFKTGVVWVALQIWMRCVQPRRASLNPAGGGHHRNLYNETHARLLDLCATIRRCEVQHK